MSLFDWLGRRKDSSRRSLAQDLTDFYRENRTVVFSYFYRVTGDREESEELTQETFYQAVKSIHRFKAQSSLRTWLLQIARNTYRNKVREWVRERKHRSDFEELEQLGDETYNPHRMAAQKETREELSDLLLQLPVDYREVLVLKEVEGLSHADIARILGKTPPTTKVLLYRAKQKLRELVKERCISYEEPM